VTGEPDGAGSKTSGAHARQPEPNGAEPHDDQTMRIAVAAAKAQASARARSQGPQPAVDAPLRYVGLITRLIAFTVDAAIISLVALIVWVAGVLTLSVVHLSSTLEGAVYGLLGLAFVVWSVGYFVTFWATTGQTPGDRLLQFRVVQEPSHEPGMPPRRAIVRMVGLSLAVLPFGAGIFYILFNDRRRGLQDVLARTVVIEAPVLSEADRRRIAATEAISEA
jgi:uncharacterized RDD family membrane protein YckC